jgi:hypothetical protein
MNLSKKIIEVLKQNHVIINMNDNITVDEQQFKKAIKLYQENNYSITKGLCDFLKIFINLNLSFDDGKGSTDICFKTKRVFSCYPKDFAAIKQKKFSMMGIVPFALAFAEHMVIFSDENNWTFGAYDDHVVLFGYNQIEALDNILNGKSIKQFDFNEKVNVAGIVPEWK